MITGGASGLGLATVEDQLKRGNKVVVIDIQQNKDDKQFLKENFLHINCDITDIESVRDAFIKAKERFGKIDNLINCAGILSVGKMLSSNPEIVLTPEHMTKVFKINVLGTFNMIK